MTETAVQRRYTNPPIEEAIAEFRLTAGSGWDLTIPGRLHERMKHAYPGKPRQQKLLQRASGPNGELAFQEVERVQLVDSGGRRVVSVGPDVLSVSSLRPYEGWAVLRPRIVDALLAYADVTGTATVSRIGVRYINKVVLPPGDLELSDYFACAPRRPAGLPDRLVGFLDRSERMYPDGVKLLLTFARMDANPGTSAFLLDLDVVWEGPRPLSLEESLTTVDDLHVREGLAFEAMITDKARGAFHGS